MNKKIFGYVFAIIGFVFLIWALSEEFTIFIITWGFLTLESLAYNLARNTNTNQTAMSRILATASKTILVISAASLIFLFSSVNL